MGKIAFLFSGQGAQYSGMGKELYECSKAAQKVFAMADGLRPGTSKQCFEASKEELSRTLNTQPCLFSVDLAAAEALREKKIFPDYVAGFSLGEIPALAFSGLLSPQQAFRFVLKRAEYMDTCAQERKGVMLAIIGITTDTAREVCAAVNGCWPANYNSPTQTVAACFAESAPVLMEKVRERGGKAVRLAVSGGFHSPLMDQASAKLSQEFSDISFDFSGIPVYANAMAKLYDSKENLFSQVNSPVRWNEIILELWASGVDTFVETGAGKILSGLCAKIVPDAKILHVEDKQSLEETLKALGNEGVTC